MSDGNGRVCCILGVCCPPGSPQQRAALKQAIEDSGQTPEDYIVENFDLMPKGSTDLLKSSLAGMKKQGAQP